ncbi:MAG: helix-turn-helix transcriptional regulator [Planctomycetota bacterium]|jgi:excisionase family DNA binding protein
MQLMSIEDLAAYLGDSKRTIYKYIASGDCPPYIRISAKNIKFDRADVDAWLESKKVVPTVDLVHLREKLPWTPRARRVMKAAGQAAQRYNLSYVGTGQMLIGIVDVKDCLGAAVLKNLGVQRQRILAQYEQLGKDGAEQVSHKLSGGKQNLTDSAQAAIDCAYEQAVLMGHEYIGAEHLLLGILLVRDGLGHQILTQLGLALESVRSETAKLIACRSGLGQ